MKPFLTILKHNPKNKWFLLLFMFSILSIVYINISIQNPNPNLKPLTNPQELSVISVFPPAGTSGFTYDRLAFVFTFNQPINLNKIKVALSPDVEYFAEKGDSSYQLSLRPKQPWKTKIPYTVVLTDSLNNTIFKHTVTFIPVLETGDFIEEEREYIQTPSLLTPTLSPAL